MTTLAPPEHHLRINKWWLIGGGIAGAGVFVVYRRKASAATATTAVNAATTDPTIDPATGVAYTDESTYTGITSGSPWSALSGLSYNAQTGSYEPINSTATNTTPTDNASWAKQITDYLVGEGYDQSTVTSALGSYLSDSGETLTSGQSSIVQAALAYGGNPPVAVPTPVYAPSSGQASGTPVTGFTPGDMNTERNDATTAIYQIESDGSLYHLSPAQYAELGNPTSTTTHYSDANQAI